MRIIAFANRNSGPAYHQIIMPLMLMNGPEVYITNDLQVEHFEKGCDILMYNRVLPDHAMEKIRELQKQYGFKIVVDIDDYWQLDPHHILYQEYQDNGFAAEQIQHLRGADAILTTHDRLAEAIREVVEMRVIERPPYVVTPKVHVCPNAIPHQGQFDVPYQQTEFVRLFWQGSITHQHDIELLRTPIEALGKISKQTKMVMAGYEADEPAWADMARIYTANRKHQYALIQGCHVANYYAGYGHADICLVPLLNTPFNRMKSNLKILEAGNLGLPVIASGVHPYLGLPVNFCKNSRDWIGHIKRLVAHPARRQEEGERLAEYCHEHYNFFKINAGRCQILEYVASKTSA
jgi:glycosyltransferase involved in cell wall biosynthesis